MQPLTSQFKSALAAIEINGRHRDFAVAAHKEIRSSLEMDTQLRAWGIETVLIGSYARRTGISPGKDVDVFAKLTKLSVGSTDPRAVFEYTRDVLVGKYGERAEPQSRSIKVSFDRDGFEFSVDVVPAVRWGSRWAIPRRDTATWDKGDDERWVETDPEQLTRLTERLNAAFVVDGRGAYVPTVKLVRQARRHHRGDAKPGGFYFELMVYHAFDGGDVDGNSFAELFSSVLGSVAKQLDSGAPLCDPVLGRDYRPTPSPNDRAEASRTFADLSRKAAEALATDDTCKAGALWREILGRNDKGWCFPVPDGCDEHGNKLPVTAASARGSKEGGGFA